MRLPARRFSIRMGFMEIVGDIRNLPALDREAIHVWGVHVPEMHDRLDALQAFLSENEREKASRFKRRADRISSVTARGALRVLLSAYTGIPPAGISFEYSENGKPHVQDSDVSFNVSHSADWIVLAFGRNRNIGVDVEKIKQDINVEAIAERYFAAAEIDLIANATDKHTVFFQLWARKEAYVKARGEGLFKGLHHFEVPVENGVLPDNAKRDGWFFLHLESGPKYASAIVTDQPASSVPCYEFGGLKWES